MTSGDRSHSLFRNLSAQSADFFISPQKNIDQIEGQEIYKFLEIVDADFYPKLSHRPGAIKAFINEFILRRGEIFVYKEPMIIAAIGYWNRGEKLDDCYCHLLAILAEYRKSRIGYTLLNEAFKTVDKAKLSIFSQEAAMPNG